MNKKNRLLIGVTIIVVLLGYLLLTSGTSNQYEVSGAVAEKANLTGKVIIVNGSLVKGTDQWDPLTKTLNFKMTDGIETIDVVYIGDLPNMPAEVVDIQTIVTGQFNGNRFEAFRMLTKCPSKYEGENSFDPNKTQPK